MKPTKPEPIKEWILYFCSKSDDIADIYLEDIAGPKPERPRKINVVETEVFQDALELINLLEHYMKTSANRNKCLKMIDDYKKKVY